MPNHSRPDHRRCRIAVVALVMVAHQLSLTPLALMAAELRLEGSALEIHHRDRFFVDPVNNRKAALTSRPVFILRNGDSFSLILKDQNPLLFTYNVTTTETESEQHKTAALFAKTLADLVKPFESRIGGGAGDRSQPLVVEGLDIADFRSQLRDVNAFLNSIPGMIERSIGTSADIDGMTAAVRQWNMSTLATKVREAYARVPAIAAKCLAGQPVVTNAGPRPCSSSINGLPDSTPTNAPASGQGQAAQPGRGGSGQPTAAPIGNNAAPRPGRGGPVVTPASNGQNGTDITPSVATPPVTTGDTIAIFIALGESHRSEVLSALEVLTGFAADALEVGTSKTLKCRASADDCGYSLADQTTTISVKASPKYNAFIAQAAPAVKKFQTGGAGEFSIEIKPYTPAFISVAPAFVLLFAENPTYSAEKSGNGFIIKADDPPVDGYNLAAMMTIRPRSWREPTFGGQFQIGVSPTKDKMAIYGGGGISVQSLFTIGAGVAWQQVTRLADGLSEGQTIATADELKTRTRFVPGLYIHVTVNTK